MYITLAIIAGLIFFYSLVARGVEKTIISGPMVFVAIGVLVGAHGLGWLGETTTRNELRVFADLTLALILFIDAANADLGVLKRQFRIPSRMLVLGLPGVIALGFGFAVLLFDGLTLYEAAILATMLAATDAALGKAVITNEAVPPRIREGLNVESGLNDGLCVPVLLFFIALASSTEAANSGGSHALMLIAEELGIGMVVGLGFAAVGATLLRWCWKQDWVSKIWIQATVPALALASFAVAQSLHGSGYIAAFTGGLLFGSMAKESTHRLVHAAEGAGEVLALMTWVLFGAAVIGDSLDLLTWEVFVYAVLSLTVIRIVPIFLSLIGTGESVSSRMFLGWFGPRGLASIVFAVIVMDANLPGSRFISAVVVTTVILSLVAHGVSAKPLAAWLGRKEAKQAAKDNCVTY
jgi:NhaP-type Na+/H+ or K+/H+ antiporter